jgi:hypothetical protein
MDPSCGNPENGINANTMICFRMLVGERGFEPPTPWSRTRLYPVFLCYQLVILLLWCPTIWTMPVWLGMCQVFSLSGSGQFKLHLPFIQLSYGRVIPNDVLNWLQSWVSTFLGSRRKIPV